MFEAVERSRFFDSLLCVPNISSEASLACDYNLIILNVTNFSVSIVFLFGIIWVHICSFFIIHVFMSVVCLLVFCCTASVA